jgi:hypothetical protein
VAITQNYNNSSSCALIKLKLINFFLLQGYRQMTTVTLELSSDIYQQLYDKSHKQGRTIEKMIQEWIIEHIASPSPTNLPEQARQILNTAGLETQLSPELQKLAENSTATLEQVQAAFAKAGGQPLSEMVIEMRGPKV